MKKYVLISAGLLTIGLLLWYYGVSTEETPSQGVVNSDCITIEVNDPKDINELNLIDTVRFLKLEAKDSSYFGFVTKMRVCEDRFFLLDTRSTSSSVLIFTREGKHIKTLSPTGRGPGEFLNLTNFEIDYVNKRLLIMDDPYTKILFFDFNGNFIREITSEFGASDAACLQGKRIVHAKTPDEYWTQAMLKDSARLIITEDDGKNVYKYYNFNYPPKMRIRIRNAFRSIYDGTINYVPLLYDTIYSIYGDGYIKPKYAISYKDKVSNDYAYALTIEEFNSKIAHGKNCFLGAHIETEDYVYFRLGIAWYNNPVFFDKRTHKAIMVGRERKGALHDLFDPKACDNTYFWGIILPEKIKTLDYKQAVIDNENLDITEDDNPWLFYYKLKEI